MDWSDLQRYLERVINPDESMLTRILYLIAILISSVLLIAFAYDISEGKTIPLSSTKEDTQKALVFLADKLGVLGSWIVGITASGISLFRIIYKKIHEKNP